MMMSGSGSHLTRNKKQTIEYKKQTIRLPETDGLFYYSLRPMNNIT